MPEKRRRRSQKNRPVGMGTAPPPPVMVGVIAMPAHVVNCTICSFKRLMATLLATETLLREQPELTPEDEEHLQEMIHDRSHLNQITMALFLALEHGQAATETFFGEMDRWMNEEVESGRLPPPPEEEDDFAEAIGRGIGQLLDAALEPPPGFPDPEKRWMN